MYSDKTSHSDSHIAVAIVQQADPIFAYSYNEVETGYNSKSANSYYEQVKINKTITKRPCAATCMTKCT